MASLHDLGKISIERKVVVPPLPPLPAAETRPPDSIAAHPCRTRAGNRRRSGLGRSNCQPDHHQGWKYHLVRFRLGHRACSSSSRSPPVSRQRSTRNRATSRSSVTPTIRRSAAPTCASRRIINSRSSAPRTLPRFSSSAWRSPIVSRPTARARPPPIADNKTPEGRARNRRVEILIPREETLTAEEKSGANSNK